jgi:hypothetical protein
MAGMDMPFKDRIFAFSGYLGLAPLYALHRKDRDAFAALHLASALMLGVCVALLAVVFFLLLVLLSLAMVFARPVFEAIPMERLALDLWGALWLLWAFAWFLGMYRALRGRVPAAPGVEKAAARIAATQTWRPVAGIVLAFYAVLVLLGAAAWRGSVLANANPVSAKVYMLYDDMGWVPRWVFALGFYRVTDAADAAWGRGSTAITPLTETSLATALKHGQYIFVASHGDETGFYNRERWFTPEDVAALEQNPRPQFIYITGCDTGHLAKRWEEALEPARTVTFNRLSATLEHAIWLWLRGPAIVDGLQRPVD